MKNYFDQLKAQVPSIAKKERVAKVIILRESTVYINTMTEIHEHQKAELDELARINKLLLKKAAKFKEKNADSTQEDPSRMRRLQRRYWRKTIR